MSSALVAMGVVIQAVGWATISYVQGHLPAPVVSPTLLGQPIVTAILAIPILGESLSQTEVLGGITVLIGVLIVHRSRL